MNFKITYTDPETQETMVVKQVFEDSKDLDISAREWAEDYAYSLADKGWHKVEVIK
jgi:hypothetical protein